MGALRYEQLQTILVIGGILSKHVTGFVQFSEYVNAGPPVIGGEPGWWSEQIFRPLPDGVRTFWANVSLMDRPNRLRPIWRALMYIRTRLQHGAVVGAVG